MKKLIYLAPIIIIFSFFYFQEEEKRVTEITPRTNKKKSDVFLAARKQTIADSKAEFDVRCFNLKNKLDDIDFNIEASEWLSRIKSDDFNCEDSSLKARFELIKKTCFERDPKDDCSFHVLVLRSILRTKGLIEGANQEELADLIIKEFSEKDLNFKNLLSHAEKFLELDPSNILVQKLWAMAKTLSQDDIKKLSPEVIEDIYSNLSEETWQDPQMKGLDLILKSGLEPKAVEDHLRSNLKNSPRDPYTHEMLGWSLWQQNRRTEAISYLKEAIRLSPHDSWLREMYKEVSSPDPKADAYKGRVSLGLNFQDLFQN